MAQKLNRYQKALREGQKQKRAEHRMRELEEEQEARRLEDLERVKNMSYEDYILQMIPANWMRYSNLGLDVKQSDFVLRG